MSGAKSATYTARTPNLVNEHFPAYSLLQKIRNFLIFRAILTKDRFTGKGFNNVTNDSETRKNKNVDLRMQYLDYILSLFLLKRAINFGIASRSVAARRAR